MDVEREFPYEGIADELGEIVFAEQVCGDVYLITTRDFETYLPSEYYIFPEHSAILSAPAKAYGVPVPGCPELRMVQLGFSGSGSSAVHYEILRHKIRNNIPMDEDIREVAVYGMESDPDYFGTFPAPMDTPRGAVLRYLQIINGIFALETESGDRLIAIAYPIWADSLSDYTMQYGLQTARDLAAGIDCTFGYLFFEEETGCLPLLELSRSYDYPEDVIHMYAVKNAVFERFPDYMVQYNRNEISGLNDSQGMLCQLVGADMELSGDEKNLIAYSPEAGTEYLTF